MWPEREYHLPKNECASSRVCVRALLRDIPHGLAVMPYHPSRHGPCLTRRHVSGRDLAEIRQKALETDGGTCVRACMNACVRVTSEYCSLRALLLACACALACLCVAGCVRGGGGSGLCARLTARGP